MCNWWSFGKVKKPCSDCVNGHCTMNCSDTDKVRIMETKIKTNELVKEMVVLGELAYYKSVDTGVSGT